ncbi:hypothetical protein FRB96_003923 [Tulasnella sp. 330]|nr:hypothetical protein FRB96_003923 [Tulasnella sp. 330]KAG8876479.1 hypothetical protein FRB97_004140 [Tulasnella sp. 331]
MAQNGDKTSEQSKWVRITTRDGWSYIVERKVAFASSHFADALSDNSGFTESRSNSCHLEERAAVAEKVVEYLAYKAQWSGQKGPIPDFSQRVPPEIALELVLQDLPSEALTMLLMNREADGYSTMNPKDAPWSTLSTKAPRIIGDIHVGGINFERLRGRCLQHMDLQLVDGIECRDIALAYVTLGYKVARQQVLYCFLSLFNPRVDYTAPSSTSSLSTSSRSPTFQKFPSSTMVYSLALLGNLLLASAALAAPSSRLGARLERRRNGQQSKPINRLTNDHEVSNVEYSSNWAGAVYDSYPSGTFKSVTGTFIVPTPKAASGSSSGSASAWVGIDGDTCGNAILQTGVDFTVTNGAVSYDAWYEWYPDYAYDFSGITISAGDSITTTVTATSTKAGTAVITNNTTGKTVTKSLTSTYALCEENAEWIVEDYEEGSSLVTFANFGTVTFTGASAGLVAGGSIGPGSADTIDIEQNSQVLTSVLTTSTSVTVSYV